MIDDRSDSLNDFHPVSLEITSRDNGDIFTTECGLLQFIGDVRLFMDKVIENYDSRRNIWAFK